jgi:hypothetical protein
MAGFGFTPAVSGSRRTDVTEERTEDEGVPAPDEPIQGADELPADVRDGDVSDVEDAPE